MTDYLFVLRGKVIHFFYKFFLKPLFFSLDTEHVHNSIVGFGEFLGRFQVTKAITRFLFFYKHRALEQKILGIKFKNPIILAAGFDYEARLTQILPDVGFGGMTVGSITWESYEGNKPPRLGRLPKSRSLLVNKGLKSTGTKNVFKNLKGLSAQAGKKFEAPLGINFAKTNSKNTIKEKGGIEDYVASFAFWEKQKGPGDYYELNISCPNAFGGEPFTTPPKLEELLRRIDRIQLKKPLFLKMPIDLSISESQRLCRVAIKHKVDGLIFGNLTKDRSNPNFDKQEIKSAGKGSFSGKPTEKRSNALVKWAYKNYGQRFVIIGCGGVFSGEDAYKKIKLGASLVQLITGMIFEGPQVIGQINQDISSLLKKDGYENISEAVGKSVY